MRRTSHYRPLYMDVVIEDDGTPVFRLPVWLWIYFAVIALLVVTGVTRSMTGPISTPWGVW